MDSLIFLFLFQDGVLSGAIYALLAVAFVLLFSVTRIIFIAQGDFVAYAGLTLSALERSQIPGSVWMVLGLGIAAGIREIARQRRSIHLRRLIVIGSGCFLLPLIILALCWLGVGKFGSPARFLLTLAIVVPMGPYIYLIFFKSMAESSILNLLIVSVGVHWMMTGLGLLFFGAEGYRTEEILDISYELGPLLVSGQSILVLILTALVLLLLYAFFHGSLEGKALRAAAVSSRGAGLVGISPANAGMTAFLMAALIGTVSGILISPITTLYYDSGFLIGLKGFIAAIIGGFGSYLLAVLGAFSIGIAEAFSSFWASAYKEVIVFGLIIPVLIWRSIFAPHPEEE
ncbi:MAG TPA: branched-chain amino acid ABC transporter permease [Pseudorhizobium sp.]|nr:branched-chain amino acid ABC transporter permease [Pseudorhizobium sp.]